MATASLGQTGTTQGTLTISPEPSIFNQPIGVTVVITGVNNTAVPTGSVSFTLDGLAVGSTSLVNGAASLTFTPSTTVTAGVHTLGVQYGGDSNYSAAAFSTTHTITLRTVPVTITLSASATSALRSQTIRLMASISAPDSTITPMIGFSDNGLSLGTSTIVNGTGQFDTNLLSVGTNTITATYIGLNNTFMGIAYPATTSMPVTVVISAVPTTTTLTASASTITSGSPITLTATTASTTTTPFGSVSFYDGTSLLGTSLAINGQASWATSFTSTGDHSLTAAFQNNETFAGSTSAAVPVHSMTAADAAPSSLALTVQDSGSVGSVSLVATLASVAMRTELSNREVGFFDGGTFLGNATTSTDGVAALSSVPRTAGGHTYYAVLLSDNQLQAFVSPPLIVFNSTAADFAFSPSVTRVFISRTSPVLVRIALSRENGFVGSVIFSCHPNRPELTCSTVSSEAGTTTLRIGAADVAKQQDRGPFPVRYPAAALATLIIFCLPTRGRRVAVLALCSAVLPLLLGCGTPMRQTLPILGVITVQATATDSVATLVHGQQIQVVMR